MTQIRWYRIEFNDSGSWLLFRKRHVVARPKRTIETQRKSRLLTVSLHLSHGSAGLALAALASRTSRLLDAGTGRLGLGSGSFGGRGSHYEVARFEYCSIKVNCMGQKSQQDELMKIENWVVWKMHEGEGREKTRLLK